MPIEVGIWRIDSGNVEPVPASSLDSEARLEDVLEHDPTILGLDSLLVIGRRVITKYGKRVDLLAIDVEGTLHVIELKKDRTPREVVAQALDYGFWVRQLDDEAIADLYAHHHGGPPSQERSSSSSGRSLRARSTHRTCSSSSRRSWIRAPSGS